MTSFIIESYGCEHVQADGEQMAGWLQEARFEAAKNLEDADIVIFCTCTTQGISGLALEKRIEEIKREHPYKMIIITGCIPKSLPEKWKKYPFLGPRQFHHIVEAVEERLHNNVVHFLEEEEILPSLTGPRQRKNAMRQIIPITRSCVVGCMFCKKGGTIRSYSVEEIKEVVSSAVESGVREIVLTSHDTFSYGLERESSLPQLLKELITVPGKFKIRLGMSSPAALRQIKKELVPLLRNDKLFQHLHLALPSASTKVLQDMNLEYTAGEVHSFLEEARQAIPELNVIVEMAVGFPTETDDDHWQTMQFLRACTPDTTAIVPFTPLPKTPFALLQALPSEVIEHRMKVLTDMVHNTAILQNERWREWQGPVILVEKSSEPGWWLGRNTAYKTVLVKGEFAPGDLVKVRISKVYAEGLWGEVER